MLPVVTSVPAELVLHQTTANSAFAAAMPVNASGQRVTQGDTRSARLSQTDTYALVTPETVLKSLQDSQAPTNHWKRGAVIGGLVAAFTTKLPIFAIQNAPPISRTVTLAPTISTTSKNVQTPTQWTITFFDQAT